MELRCPYCNKVYDWYQVEDPIDDTIYEETCSNCKKEFEFEIRFTTTSYKKEEKK